MEKKKLIIVAIITLLGLGAIVLYQKLILEDGRLQVVFCDVGQGDAIFLRTPNGSDILIDGGPDRSVLECLSRHMPFWDRRLELVLLTHLHADHLNGLVDVIQRYSILQFVETDFPVQEETEGQKRLQEELTRRNVSVRKVFQGEVAKLNEIKIIVLWPTRDAVKYLRDVNDASIVLLFTFKDFEVLLTGDASTTLLNTEEINGLDILKVPHHGAKTGMDEDFLDRVRPSMAVISVGKNNRYGHPHEEIIKILRDEDIKILRTDQDGEIVVVSDGHTWSVRTKR